MEIFSTSRGVNTFHAIIDNFSTAGQVTPPALMYQSFSQLGPCVHIAK